MFIFCISECGWHDWGSSHWSKVGSQMLGLWILIVAKVYIKPLKAHFHSFPIIHFAFRGCSVPSTSKRIFAVTKSNPKWKHKNGLSPSQQKEDDLRSSVSFLFLCPCFFVYFVICLFVYNMFVFWRQLLLSLSLGGSPTSAHWPGGFRGQQAQVLMMMFVMMVYMCVCLPWWWWWWPSGDGPVASEDSELRWVILYAK